MPTAPAIGSTVLQDLDKLRIDRTSDSALRTVSVMPLLVAGFLAIAGVLLYRGFFKNTEEVRVSSLPPDISAGVEPAVTVSSEPSTGVLNATGYVVAQRKAAVASKATGRLVELRVEEGDVVRMNQVLGTLENEDLKATLHQRQAQIEATDAQIASAEAEVQDALLGRDRAMRLRSDRVASQEQLDSALARYRKAVAQLAAAQANKRLALADYERAKVDLSYTAIQAPFDGTVLTKNADVGEIVAPFGSATSARAAIVTIADMSSLQIEADVSEANLKKVYVGQACEITLDSIPGRRYRGTVSKIVPTVDRAKGTVMTKIRFENLEPEIIPQMSAKIAFELAEGR